MTLQNTKDLRSSLNKYIALLVLFLLVLFVGIYIYAINFKNILSANDIVSEVSQIQDKASKESNFEIGKDYGLSGINQISSGIEDLNSLFSSRLKNFISNTNLIEGDFQKSAENIKTDPQQYYFNLGNLYLLSGYYLALSGTTTQHFINSYSNIFQSTGAYQRSLNSILSGNSNDVLKEKITVNMSAASVMEYLINVKLCLSIFGNIISQLTGISQKIDTLKGLITEQSSRLKDLIAQTTDQSIKSCLQDYMTQLNTSMNSLITIDSFIKDLNKSSAQNIQNSIDQKLNCYENRAQYTSGIQTSLDKVGSSVNNFLQIHSVVNQILNSKDPKALSSFCNSNGNYPQQSDNLNNQMNDGLNELNDMLNNQNQKGNQPQEDNKEGEEEQKSGQEGDKKQEDNNKTGNQPQHKDILNEEEKSLMEDVENKSQNWINEMQDIKGSGVYNPEDYLNNLFRDFRGNSDDFKSQDSTNGPGYDRKW